MTNRQFLPDIAQAQMLFGIPQRVGFRRDDDGNLLVLLTAPGSEAVVGLRGGHVRTWRRTGGAADVLWLADRRPADPAKRIRGGIPICWPWFGAHRSDPNAPAHGIARSAQFQMVGSWVDAERTFLQLSLADRSALSGALSQCELSLQFTIGEELRVDLTTVNLSVEPVGITQALHSYFRISDIGAVRVEGLEGCAYIDTLDGWRTREQIGAVTFGGEVDRIYASLGRTIRLVDPGFSRTIRIDCAGSQSAVVWNPWIEKSQRLGDMAEDDYRRMVCIETANAGGDVIALAPALAHRLSAVIREEPTTAATLSSS